MINPLNILYYLLMFIQLSEAITANQEWFRIIWIVLFIVTMIVKDATCNTGKVSNG